MSPYGRLGLQELVLAYELLAEGCSWRNIASGLGVDPDYLRQRIRQVKANGLPHARRFLPGPR